MSSASEHYDFQTDRPVDLYVEIGKGHVAVSCADTDQSTVEVRGRRAGEVVVTRDGDEIRVVEPRRAGGVFHDSSLHVAVVVPQRSDVTVRTGSAGIEVTGTAGSAILKSGSGDVVVEDVDGRVQVDTGSGDVTVGDARGEAHVKSGSGDAVLDRVGGEEASVSTGSGDVEIRCADAPVGVKTGSGDLRVRQSCADLTASSGSGDVTVDRAERGTITARGASGDVRVGVPVGVPVWTDLLTVTGDVRTDIEPTGAPADGQDHVELHAKTVSGDITLSNC